MPLFCFIWLTQCCFGGGGLFQFDLVANIEKSRGFTYKPSFLFSGNSGPSSAALLLPKGMDPPVCCVPTLSIVPWLVNLGYRPVMQQRRAGCGTTKTGAVFAEVQILLLKVGVVVVFTACVENTGP